MNSKEPLNNSLCPVSAHICNPFSFLDSLCGRMDVLDGNSHLPQSVVLLWTAIRWNCRPCIPVHKGHLSFLLFCLPFCSSVKTHTERRAVFAARCIAD